MKKQRAHSTMNKTDAIKKTQKKKEKEKREAHSSFSFIKYLRAHMDPRI